MKSFLLLSLLSFSKAEAADLIKDKAPTVPPVVETAKPELDCDGKAKVNPALNPKAEAAKATDTKALQKLGLAKEEKPKTDIIPPAGGMETCK